MKKSTFEDFVRLAEETHGSKYDYTRVEYINNKSPVEIGCRVHGWFLQTPNNHLRSNGCSRCRYDSNSLKRRKNAAEFITQAVIVHGNRYSYCDVTYVSAHAAVTINCHQHGQFEQSPNSHLKGRGCPKCATLISGERRRSSTEVFVTRSISVHGDSYTYDRAVYEDCKEPVVITCKIHGDFIQNPRDHLSGCGCPSCSANGFTKHRVAFLYVLRSPIGVKIGITHNVKNRVAKLRYGTPFNFKLVHVVKSDGYTIRCLERRVHGLLTPLNLKGFDGCSEWFNDTDDVMRIINDELCQAIHGR